MNFFLLSCRDTIDEAVNKISYLSSSFERQHSLLRAAIVSKALELLQIAVKHKFANLQHNAETKLICWCQSRLFPYDISFVCLPVQRNSGSDEYVSSTCPILWRGMISLIAAHLSCLTFQRVDKSDLEMFSYLLHSYLRYGNALMQ